MKKFKKKNEIIYIDKIIKFYKNKKSKNIHNCISKNCKKYCKYL